MKLLLQVDEYNIITGYATVYPNWMKGVEIEVPDEDDPFFGESHTLYRLLDGAIARREDAETLLSTQQTAAEQQERQVAIQQAKAYLDSTDWYVVRFSETGVPIPEEVTGKRAAARLVC